ncbi:MAG: hypothetical protein JJT78_04875 [Leptospira sp.]|nr:hypothetical protein [Leptospira sp.]
MVETKIQADIPLPVETVFGHVSKLENMVDYNSSVKSCELVSSSEEGLPIYKIDIDIGIKRFSCDYQVTEFIPNKKIVALARANDIEFEDTYIFEESDMGTHFEIIDRTKLKGFFAMSEFLLAPIMNHQMNHNLKTLLSILKKK